MEFSIDNLMNSGEKLARLKHFPLLGRDRDRGSSSEREPKYVSDDRQFQLVC